MNDDSLLRLWGKTDKTNPGNYHPLLFHLLDVGHVIQRLWWDALSSRSRGCLATALGLNQVATERLVTLLGAQHDLGKASAFQHKDKGLWKRLNDVGLDIPVLDDKPHGYVSAKTLPALAVEGVGGWQANKDVARALAKVTGGHHGTFPTSADLTPISPLTLGGKPWDAARAALLSELAGLLHVGERRDEGLIQCPLEELTAPALLPLLGGLISVADWIGSSHHFHPISRMATADYVSRSRDRTQKALESFGWTSTPAFSAPAAFGEIFRDAEERAFVPNAMQKQAVAWADAATEPYLLIIEAAMGDGKTEAALYATDRALTTDHARGFYVALPTQATGNAMFRRVHEYLNRHGGVLNLQLVHAGALLSEEFDALRQASEALRGAAIYDDTDDPKASAEAAGQAGHVIAEDWFTSRKRPLLARFGVGTIDQSLLGVLQTRHWFVRLLGLAGKVIVFDEVHAYDVYMSALLCRLLRWLRVLDCTVILLSATLPESTRTDLLGAWRGDDQAPESAPYPRLTLSHGDAPPEVVSVADPAAPTKNVSLAWTAPDWDSVLRQMQADLPAGGCALLLCNTVTRAQDAFRTLGPALDSGGWTIKLFHARTLAAWRREREKWVLDTFGKSGPTDRRGKKILLIATQVAEQSLDLDFDWIASEMAPGDLILQRLGRLWRHPGRLRPTDRARFVVLCGEDRNGFPVFPDYAELIYDRHVLLRSWLALRTRGDGLTLPIDIDLLVQEVYAPEMPADLSDPWRTELDASKAEKDRKKAEDEGKAHSSSLPVPEEGLEAILDLGGAEDHLRKTLWEDEDPRVHETVRAATRLGDPSIGVVCTGTDEDGEQLAPLPSGEPRLDDIRQMLQCGLPLSRPKPLYQALVKQDTPGKWKDSALLRYQRELPFLQGRATLAGYDLRLNREEGLVIEKQGKKTEE